MRVGEATNKTDLIVALNQALERRQGLKKGYETVWWNNLALLAGDHSATWDPVMSRYVDVDPTFNANLSHKKPRIVINHALAVCRTELSKLTKSKPTMTVVANSDEAGDIAATKVGSACLDAIEWKFGLAKMRKRALWAMSAMGIGAVFVGWDPLSESAGAYKVTIDPETNAPVFNPDRIKKLEEMVTNGELEKLDKEEYPLGDLDFKVYNAFQLFPDEVALDFSEVKDLITTEIANVDVVKGLYGRAAVDVRPEENLSLGMMERRMIQRVNFTAQVSEVDSGVQINTWWCLPGQYRGNDYLKNGKMIRWCQKTVVLEESEGGFPFSDNRMPFAFFEHIPQELSIWPESTLQHIRELNLEIDKTISQLIENKDYMANPMWLIASQHRIKGEIKNVAGGMVRYVHTPNIPPPQPVTGMQMPAQVENIVVNLRDQILDISGQSEVARGRVPSGVRSGVAVAYLQEQDDTKIGPTVDNMENAIAYMASLILSRVGQYYATSRLMRYYRRDGSFDVVKFKGADLKNNTDVVCQAGSAMPKSKAARQQYTLELVSLGVEKDPKKIKEMLDLGEGEPDDQDKAIAQANRENNMMQHGIQLGLLKGMPKLGAGGQDNGAVSLDTNSQPPPQDGMTPSTADSPYGSPTADAFTQWVRVAVPVKKWHNHELHLKRHYSVMMDEEFDRLSVTHPEIVRLFDEHTHMHEQALQEQQAQQAQMLQAAKGAPDGPPGQSAQPAGPAAGGPSTMSQMQVPDVIGGGALDIGARTIQQQG